MFGLFKKKITNKMKDMKLLKTLANYGVALLEKDKDYYKADGMRCVFGYCVKGVDGELESLFKIETDRVVAYYQAIRGSVYRLTINEEMFNSAIDIFYTNNKDLKKDIVALELKKV